jgi:hypothetical protein
MNRRTKFSLALLLISSSLFAQNAKNQLEINPFVRLDAYTEFTYNYSRVSTNYLRMKGLSWGITTSFKKAFAHRYYLKLGAGYYRYTFNKLHNYHPPFGTGNTREVDYPSPLFILFYTDKYWYNTIAGNLGLERWFALKSNLKITTGINWNPYFAYSKNYHITYGSNGTTHSVNYVVPQKRYFGYSVNLTAGIQKQVKCFLIGPTIILPVYDRWKKDEKFGENDNEHREKWFNGIGLGITISKDLNF